MNGANIRYVGEQTAVTSLTQMQKLKSKGFNSVRLVMDWEAFQPSAGTGGFSTTAFNNLKAAVDNAKSAGIYVILDPIHFGGTGTSCGSSALCIPSWARVSSGGTYQGSAKSVQANAQSYIEKLATDYANEPTVVAIDLVNEPKPDPFGDDVLISMYNTLISWARGKDANKILMIETNSGDKLYDASVLSGLTRRDNIVYSFHHYSAGGCGTNAYSSSGWPCGNATYEGGAGYTSIKPAELRAHVQANIDRMAAANVNLPMWVGEWGIIEGGANSVQWRKDMTAMFKDMRIGRAYWQYANSFQDPPNENMSMTLEGSSTPGDFKSWVGDIL
jgi:aryl-phospho-beta-D-glucosidase BglC (GH1 family)